MPYLIKLFDYLSVAALIFMSYGVLKQWLYIYKSRSAKDIVTQEVVIRFIITAVLFIKIILIKDPYLIVGQAIFLISISIYAFTLLKIKNL